MRNLEQRIRNIKIKRSNTLEFIKTLCEDKHYLEAHIEIGTLMGLDLALEDLL